MTINGKEPTVVCVKNVKKGMPQDEWDETMPLPGDIIQSVSAAVGEVDDSMVAWAAEKGKGKGKSELSAELKKLSRQGAEWVTVRVRRGDTVVELKAQVAPEKGASLSRRYTIRAERDNRHVAMLADLTLDQCSELQEMSRRVVHVDTTYRCDKTKGINYDWRRTLGTYLPDLRCTVICSILFIPFSQERSVESTTSRCMAWFSAAVSSGAPLVFVNIQTEHILDSAKYSSPDVVARQSSWSERSWYKQKNLRKSISPEMVQGIRLWFLPGVAEILFTLTLEPGESRFGMDLKRTEEGFICLSSASKKSAADRAGLRKLCKEAREGGHLVVISRLEGNSVSPSLVSSDGLIHCCGHEEIKERILTTIDRREDIRLHIMAWSGLKLPPVPLMSVPKSFLTGMSDRKELEENQV